MSRRKTALRPPPSTSPPTRMGWRAVAGGFAVLIGFAAFEDVRIPAPRVKPSPRAALGEQPESPRARPAPEPVQPVATPVPAARPAASAASVADVPLEAAYRAAPSPSLEAPTPVPTHALDAEPVRSAPPPAPRVPHRVPFAPLAAWLKPGMCGSSSDADAVRATLTANFREVSPDEGGTLYLDPRLPVDAGQPILQALRLTEYEIETVQHGAHSFL